jgi:hypothetical protein
VAIVGYEYRVDGGAAVDVGLVLAVTVSGLTPSTTYGIELRSYNDEGEYSRWSRVRTATTAEPDVLAPCQVYAFTGAEVDPTTCSFTWMAADDDCGETEPTEEELLLMY